MTQVAISVSCRSHLTHRRPPLEIQNIQAPLTRKKATRELPGDTRPSGVLYLIHQTMRIRLYESRTNTSGRLGKIPGLVYLQRGRRYSSYYKISPALSASRFAFSRSTFACRCEILMFSVAPLRLPVQMLLQNLSLSLSSFSARCSNQFSQRDYRSRRLFESLVTSASPKRECLRRILTFFPGILAFRDPTRQFSCLMLQSHGVPPF